MIVDDMLRVRMLEPALGADARLVEQLTDLINDVYAVAERGLWREGTTRTSLSGLARLVAAGEIAVAARDGRIAGVERIHDVAADAAEFGMLAADPDQRGTGVGRELVAFAERRARERGLRVMQLELLVPRTWSHPSKEFLKAWYGRCGYRLIGKRTVEAAHPQLAPLLATACDVEVHEKPLQ